MGKNGNRKMNTHKKYGEIRAQRDNMMEVPRMNYQSSSFCISHCFFSFSLSVLFSLSISPMHSFRHRIRLKLELCFFLISLHVLFEFSDCEYLLQHFAWPNQHIIGISCGGSNTTLGLQNQMACRKWKNFVSLVAIQRERIKEEEEKDEMEEKEFLAIEYIKK